VEDWEEGEEERRGRSLEVKDGKRRMRSASPRLDAVMEGDESRRSSRASIEGFERKPSPEANVLPVVEESVTPAVAEIVPLPVVEVVAFGQQSGDDTESSEHEHEAGFFAFAERQMVEEKKASDARQLDVPKRSKTMSFLGFGKRKSAVVDCTQTPTSTSSVPRSATSSRLLGLPPAAPKRSSTLATPAPASNRTSRLVSGQRSSTLLAEPLSPRIALSPTMYSIGDIHTETGKIEDDESRRLSEAVFMF